MSLPADQRQGYGQNLMKEIFRLEASCEEPEWPRIRCASPSCDMIETYKKTLLTVSNGYDIPGEEWRGVPRTPTVNVNHC